MKDWEEMTPKKVLIVLFIIIAIMAVFSGCGTTKTTQHNCTLMEQGQKCLTDHTCCKN